MNRIIIMGRLGRDPEVRTTQSGKAVTSFSVATSRKTKEKEVTQWHNVVAWEKLADICGKYLAKGSQVLVEGEMTYREYEDKNKVKRTQAEIVASNVQFIGSKIQDKQQAAAPSEVDDVSIPF